jgi:hypothetical protein
MFNTWEEAIQAILASPKLFDKATVKQSKSETPKFHAVVFAQTREEGLTVPIQGESLLTSQVQVQITCQNVRPSEFAETPKAKAVKAATLSLADLRSVLAAK